MRKPPRYVLVRHVDPRCPHKLHTAATQRRCVQRRCVQRSGPSPNGSRCTRRPSAMTTTALLTCPVQPPGGRPEQALWACTRIWADCGSSRCCGRCQHQLLHRYGQDPQGQALPRYRAQASPGHAICNLCSPAGDITLQGTPARGQRRLPAGSRTSRSETASGAPVRSPVYTRTTFVCDARVVERLTWLMGQHGVLRTGRNSWCSSGSIRT